MAQNEDDKKKRARVELESLIARISRATNPSELSKLKSIAAFLMAEYGLSDLEGSLNTAYFSAIAAPTLNVDEHKALEELKNAIDKAYHELLLQKAANEKIISEAAELLTTLDTMLKKDPKKYTQEDCQNFNAALDKMLQKQDVYNQAFKRQEECLYNERKLIDAKEQLQEKQIKRSLTTQEKEPYDKMRVDVADQEKALKNTKMLAERVTLSMKEVKSQYAVVTLDNIADVQKAINDGMQSTVVSNNAIVNTATVPTSNTNQVINNNIAKEVKVLVASLKQDHNIQSQKQDNLNNTEQEKREALLNKYLPNRSQSSGVIR